MRGSANGLSSGFWFASAWVWYFSIIAGSAFILLIWHEWNTPEPIVQVRILKNRNRGGSFLTIVLAQIGMFGTFLFLTYLLQTVDHFSPVKTGLAFLPLMAANGVAATQLASRLMPHLRTRLLVTPGLLIGAVGVGLDEFGVGDTGDQAERRDYSLVDIAEAMTAGRNFR